MTLQVVGEYSYDLDGEVELEDVMEKVTVLLNWEFKGEGVCKGRGRLSESDITQIPQIPRLSRG